MSTASIFISHTSSDNGFCRKLFDFLKLHLPETDIFYDESELNAGDDWIRRIQQEVIKRSLFIVVLSPRSVVAEWVREETNLALSRSITDKLNRRIIPIKIANCDIDLLAPLLTTRQIIDLSEDAPESHWQDLIRLMRGEVSDTTSLLDALHLADMEHVLEQTMQVHQAFEAKQWRTVVRLGHHVVKLAGNERDATLWGELGIALVHVGEAVEGMHALDKALGINRYRSDLWRAKAQALVESNDLDGAIIAWDMALITTRKLSEKLDIFEDIYIALTRTKRWVQVLDIIEEVLEITNDSMQWQARKMDTLVQLQRDATALDLVRVLTSRPDAPMELWLLRANLAYNAHFPDEVKNALTSAAQLASPDDPDIAQAQRDLLPPIPLVRFPQRLRTLHFSGKVIEGIEVITPPVCDVPAGSFTMGDGQEVDNEAHQVTVDAFTIAKYPVTVAEYACALRVRVVPEPAQIADITWMVQLARLDHPVFGISWKGTLAYIAWLSKTTGMPWRLPTEAEWEMAARGPEGRFYPWGNNWDPSKANTMETQKKGTTPIGEYLHGASFCEVQDMAGNVWERTTSLYAAYPYQPDKAHEDMSSQKSRVLRGGSWHGNARNARSTFRLLDTDYQNLGAGFRLALAK
jgi:formylglycine-generating enzyme required for sulfatase activity